MEREKKTTSAVEWYTQKYGGESTGYCIWCKTKPPISSGMRYSKKKNAWWIHCADVEELYKELQPKTHSEPEKPRKAAKKPRKTTRRDSARKAAETRKRNLYYTSAQVKDAEHFAALHDIKFRNDEDISLEGAFVLAQLYGYNKGTASLEGNGIPAVVEDAFRTGKPEQLFENPNDPNTLVLYPFETITTNNDSCVLYDSTGKAWTREMYARA